MLSHVKNKLEITGRRSQVKEVLSFLRSEPRGDVPERFIDFNKISPMPEELNIKHDMFVASIKPSDAGLINSLTIKELAEYCADRKSEAEDIADNFNRGVINYVKYGHASWCGWSLENWGNVYNAFKQQQPTYNTVLFETDRSGVPDLIEKLSGMYPETGFIYRWGRDGEGEAYSDFSYLNGSISTRTPEIGSREYYELSFHLRPETAKYYELRNGTFELK